MGFFDYFIRYTLIRSLNRIFKPKTLLTIVIILLIVFFVFKINSYAIYEGDDTYTDNNNTIFLAYDSICNDFISRMDNLKDDPYYDTIISYLNNSSYGYYIYYGDMNGLSMINGSTFAQTYMYVTFYEMNGNNSTATTYDSYQGMQTSVRKFNTIGIYSITSAIDNYAVNECYIPVALYNRRTAVITSYLQFLKDSSSSDIVTAINQQTNSINEQTNTINAQTEYLQEEPDSNDFSSSDLPSDSGVTDITTDGFNSIFTMLYDSMTREPTSSDNISIAIPFTNKSFTIPYNYTSTYVPNALRSLISMFWYYVGGLFIVKDLLSKIEKLKTGNIENVENTNIKGDLL